VATTGTGKQSQGQLRRRPKRGQRRCSGDGDSGTAVDFSSLTVPLRNPPGSRFSRDATMCYIGGMSLVSVVLKWPTPRINIFCVGYLYIVGTYDYWYQLY
jgi:hypothetical protein